MLAVLRCLRSLFWECIDSDSDTSTMRTVEIRFEMRLYSSTITLQAYRIKHAAID